MKYIGAALLHALTIIGWLIAGGLVCMMFGAAISNYFFG